MIGHISLISMIRVWRRFVSKIARLDVFRLSTDKILLRSVESLIRKIINNLHNLTAFIDA